VQAAVASQLQQIRKDNPSRPVHLMTFNDTVTVLGINGDQSMSISGDRLADEAALLDFGKRLCQSGSSPATQVAREESWWSGLEDTVFKLQEGGGTALGPALLVALGLASTSAAPAQVILCTDGLANIGCGSLDTDGVPPAGASAHLAKATDFYKRAGILAKGAGTSVSIVTIGDGSARLVDLGEVADATGGTVNQVNPMDLADEFSALLAEPPVGTSTTCTLRLHEGLYFLNDLHNTAEQSNQGQQQQQQKQPQHSQFPKSALAARDLGTVTASTVASFEFGVRPRSELTGAASQAPVREMPRLPFQLQIEYTRPADGARCLRVVTATRITTTDRSKAEKAANLAALAPAAEQQAAQLALAGEVTHARTAALSKQKLVRRTTEAGGNRRGYRAFSAMLMPVENALHDVQMQERAELGRCLSDEELDGEDGVRHRLRKAVLRRERCSDATANMLLRSKHSKGSSGFGGRTRAPARHAAPLSMPAAFESDSSDEGYTSNDESPQEAAAIRGSAGGTARRQPEQPGFLSRLFGCGASTPQ